MSQKETDQLNRMMLIRNGKIFQQPGPGSR